MEINKISEILSVAGQISPSDLAFISEQGFKTVICNRPDGEVNGQPEFESIRQSAEQAGLSIIFLPVLSSGPTAANIKEFSTALDNAASPTLAYCRTGTRSTITWALSEGAKGTPVDQIVTMAAKAGYDVSKIAAHITASRAS